MPSLRDNNRIAYLDAIRALACVAVVMIHVSTVYIEGNPFMPNFCVSIIFGSLSRIGVPLFVMISGALMLDKDYAYSVAKLKKHIIKMLVFLIFWKVFYCVFFEIIAHLIKREPIQLKQVLYAFVVDNRHLWFIYLIIGLYLITPLLRLWVKTENKKYVEYFLILAFIFTFSLYQIVTVGACYFKVFDDINAVINDKLQLKYVGGYTFYYVLGWYINNYEIKHKKHLYLLGVLGFAMSLGGSFLMSVNTGNNNLMYDNLYINVMLQSVAVFVFVKERFDGKTECGKLAAVISKYSLGIYAVHVVIISVLYEILERLSFNNAFINIPVVFTLSLALSLVGAYILSKIPLLKKVV